MANIFVSVVGTQIMGTMHHRSSFLQAYPDSKTILFYTAKTKEVLPYIQDYIKNTDHGEVESNEISMATDGPDSVPVIFTHLAEEAQKNGDRIFLMQTAG